ncbi:MAG: vWA domain-containing protein [Myxococcota bacterium]
MNRTTAFLAVAAALLLTAVIVGLPKVAAPPAPPPPPAPVVVTPPPAPPPTPVANPGSLSLTGRLSHPYLVPGTSDVFATLEVTAVDVPGSRRAPVNLAVVIDRSGSMSGAKIENARRAAMRLVELLDEQDRLTVVHYGTDVSAMAGVFATPENKVKLKRYIANISDEGGTNIGDGLAVGSKHIERAMNDFRVNRLLLLSDGQPTVGITSAQGLATVVRQIRARGVSVTSLGVGADFNEDLMQRLADVGGGSYGFISDASAMATLFQKDLEQASTMVARTASISFTLPAGVRFVEVYGRPVSQVGNTVTITLPDFSARQIEKLVVHLTATPGVRNGSVDIAAFQLAYTDLLTEKPADARLALAAMVTEDTTLALRNRDKQAVVLATKARAAVNYKKAAEALDRGDLGTAQQSLRDNEAIFFEADQVAGEGSVADERATNQNIFGLSTSAASAPEPARREAVKQMKTESLRSQGRGASLY